MPGITDRDHFAAAALTGLLAQGDDGSFSEESYARGAYRWADAMLRERAKTNLDASPEARARTDADRGRTDKADARPGKGTGDTQEPINDCVSDRSKPIAVEPVAWGVMIEGGTVFSVWLDEEEAKRERRRLKKLYEGTRHGRIVVVPLYRQPTLSDAEREVVEWAIEVSDSLADCGATGTGGEESRESAVLRGLLERLGGGR